MRRRINHLLVDTEAADVIRRIFQMVADGAKPGQIAAALNGEGVSSPKNYKAEAGCTRTPWRSIQEENFWTASLVAKFLRDERYIGKPVFGKRSRDVVGSTHTVKISRNEWIVVPNRHEAIVPEALFEKAQACMWEYREYEVSSGSGNPLKRKVICGVCGHAMQRDSRKNGSYRCVTKRLNTGFDCSEDRIPEADILEAVIDTIQVYAQYAVSTDRLLQTRQAKRVLDRKQAQRRLQTLQSRKAQLDERLQDLYERLVEGEIIPRELRCAEESPDGTGRGNFSHGLGAGAQNKRQRRRQQCRNRAIQELCRDYGIDQRDIHRAAAIHHHLPGWAHGHPAEPCR